MSDKSFCLGLMLGAVGGALLVVNSRKARMLVRKGQEDLKCKVGDFVDEKIEEMKEAELKKETKQADASAAKPKKS